MKPKFYFLSALLGGLVIFVWGAVAHMALPWWKDVMHEIPHEQAIVDAMQNSGVENGMYYGMQGMFLVTFLGKGMTDGGGGMGGMMVKEFISDALLALVLAWLLARANSRVTTRIAFYSMLVGLTSWLNVNISYWIWYHFSFGYVVLEAVDQLPGMFFAGLAIAWLLKRERTTITFEPSSARLAG